MGRFFIVVQHIDVLGSILTLFTKNWDKSTAWPVNKVRIEPSTSRLSLPVHNFTTLWGPRPPASPHKLWRNLRTKGRVPLKIAHIFPLNISKFALKKSGNFVCLGQADFCYKMWASNNCVELNPSATKLFKIKPDICKCFQKIFISFTSVFKFIYLFRC